MPTFTLRTRHAQADKRSRKFRFDLERDLLDWKPEQPQPLGPIRDRLITGLIARDGNRCYLCHDTYRRRQYEIDHVIPRAHGGPNDLANYALACQSCNRRKSDRIISIRVSDRMPSYSLPR